MNQEEFEKLVRLVERIEKQSMVIFIICIAAFLNWGVGFLWELLKILYFNR